MVIEEAPDNFTDMLIMFLEGIRANEDVVYVEEYKLVKHVSEDIINEGLEHCWGISKTEGHDLIFVVPCGHVKSCLPLVSLLHAHKMVGVAQVKFGEDGNSDNWKLKNW